MSEVSQRAPRIQLAEGEPVAQQQQQQQQQQASASTASYAPFPSSIVVQSIGASPSSGAASSAGGDYDESAKNRSLDRTPWLCFCTPRCCHPIRSLLLSPAVACAARNRKKLDFALAGWIVGSVLSSVGLILINKVIMHHFGFKFVFTLTAAHFLITAAGMEVMAWMKFFERARMPLKEMMLMAVMGIGSVAFMNFSLQFNSVGFYQVTKLLCIPCMVLIESLFYGKIYSLKVKLTLLLVLAGVAIATVTDMELTAVGSLFSALAVSFTTQFQIWMGEKQKLHALNPMQINHSQSPPAALFCACLAFIFEAQGEDPSRNVMLHAFQGAEILYILASCFLALSVNLCTYGLIGKTSPVTFQVVGHAKTCLILLGGFVLFPLPSWAVLAKNLGGIALAFLGVVVYGDVKVKADRKPRGRDLWDWACPRAVSACLDGGAQAEASVSAQYAAVPLKGAASPPAKLQTERPVTVPAADTAADTAALVVVNKV